MEAVRGPGERRRGPVTSGLRGGSDRGELAGGGTGARGRRGRWQAPRGPRRAWATAGARGARLGLPGAGPLRWLDSARLALSSAARLCPLQPHQHQVVATQELEATLPLEVIQPLEAILVPHSQGELLPILEVKDLELHQVEQAFLAIHSHPHSLMVVAQHRSQYLVVFLEDQCLLSILEDKLLTLVSLPQWLKGQSDRLPTLMP